MKSKDRSNTSHRFRTTETLLHYSVVLVLLAGWLCLIANWPAFHAHIRHWSDGLAILLLSTSVLAMASLSLWEPLGPNDHGLDV